MTDSYYVSAGDVYTDLGRLIEALGALVREDRLSVDRDADLDLREYGSGRARSPIRGS